ncbi:dolichyl-diphosphooligosaccharide--protein glycosyltransferase, partial [Clonorchis sinensis]
MAKIYHKHTVPRPESRFPSCRELRTRNYWHDNIVGKIAPWTGRFYSLLDPTYAKNHIPIIASVSEHQPTAWSCYYFDLQLLAVMFPGLGNLAVSQPSCFLRVAWQGVMVRLILVLAPVMCIVGAIGISGILKSFIVNLEDSDSASQTKASKHSSSASGLTSTHKISKSLQDTSYPFKHEIATFMVFLVAVLLVLFSKHCIWATSNSYSHPSIVLETTGHHGERFILDDYRAAYYWLRQNTKPDARVMSWWDYGYQITAIANRTVLVDNNTWNNTHIGRVGQAMASSEEEAYEIMQELDVDYVLVIFGGLLGYSSDDINKFIWMIRIAGSTEKGRHVSEHNYYSATGDLRIDNEVTPTLANSLLYKLSYYRFWETQVDR